MTVVYMVMNDQNRVFSNVDSCIQYAKRIIDNKLCYEKEKLKRRQSTNDKVKYVDFEQKIIACEIDGNHMTRIVATIYPVTDTGDQNYRTEVCKDYNYI